MSGHTPWAEIKREKAARPDPGPTDPGWKWVAQVDADFKLGGRAKRCRYSRNAVRCPNDAVATLYRPVGGHGRRYPWAYCNEHLFGRWIEAGQIMEWVECEVPA